MNVIELNFNGWRKKISYLNNAIDNFKKDNDKVKK